MNGTAQSFLFYIGRDFGGWNCELVPPSVDSPHCEGWIWLPKDVVPIQENNRGESV